MKTIVSVDLYCGMGGVTQGMISAGATVALSVDGWSVAEYLHKLNYPNVPFVKCMLGEAPHLDVAMIKHFLKATGLKRADCHFHLHGSPPCQAFSGMAGAFKRDVSEGMKNVDHFLWLVEQLKPDSWSMENVPATQNHYPHLPYQMLAAKNFGVAQLRNRFFAGKGWSVAIPDDPVMVSWNSLIDTTDVPVGSVLNTVGCTITESRRSKASDSQWNNPSLTMTRQLPSIRFENADGSFKKIRSITPNEMTTLFGFPELDLTLPDHISISDLTMAIGNGVCPPVMQAVIESIIF
jgi:site-specific DNA-cytosine methylase